MLPFCGYHMGDYFAHWLKMGETLKNPPPIFYVNWFRKDSNGDFLWPGFNENIRVLKWIFEMEELSSRAEKTPIGWIPAEGSLDLAPLQVDRKKLFSFSKEEWMEEVEELKKYFSLFGAKLPSFLQKELTLLERRIQGEEEGTK
jgi:phosphoenolpyruvate carboxykinase (GTP)